jgi:hypothetical protein
MKDFIGLNYPPQISGHLRCKRKGFVIECCLFVIDLTDFGAHSLCSRLGSEIPTEKVSGSDTEYILAVELEHLNRWSSPDL